MRILVAVERTLAIFWLVFFIWWVADGVRQLAADAEYLSVFVQTIALLSVVICCSAMLWLQIRWRYPLLLVVGLGGLLAFVVFLSNSEGFPLVDRAFGWFACALSVISAVVALLGLVRPKTSV